MQKSQQYEFEIELLINDSEIEIQQLHQTNYGHNNYREALVINDINRNAETIMKLQNTIKSQYLIIGNQQKQKGYATKKLQCEIRKAIEKYIQYKDTVSEDKTRRLLLNEKDLQDLHPNLDVTIPKFIKQLHNVKNIMKLFRDSKLEPSDSVLDDIVNFFPNFDRNIESVIKMEIGSCNRIDNVFESEWSFNSKVINRLGNRYQMEIFAHKVLERGMNKLKIIKCELITEFSEEYERIKEAVNKTKHLKHYVNGKEDHKVEKIRRDIENILHIPAGEDNGSLVHKYIEVMSADVEGSKGLKQEFMKRMDAAEDHVNVKIGLLTLKSIAFSSQQIQNIVSVFAEDILQSVDAFPMSVREMVKIFQLSCKQKFVDQYHPAVTQEFVMKTLFSKWIFTELMKIYQQTCPNLSKQIQNTNFSAICYVLQKIFFRQLLYESEKYYFFNHLIEKYKPQSSLFFKEIGNIAPRNEDNSAQCNITVGLFSFETIRYVLAILRQNLVQYMQFQPYHQLQGVFSRGTYQMYSEKYLASNLYILSAGTEVANLMRTFQPKTKLNRLVIEFLQTIPYLTEPTHLFTLIEQYKYGKEVSSITKIPVELYANYLSALISPTQPIQKIADTILKQLAETKIKQKRMRMYLESSTNYYITIQKSILEMINKARQIKMRINAQQMMENLVIKFKCFLKSGESLDWSTPSDPLDKKGIDKTIVVLDSATIKGFLRNVAQIYEDEKLYMGDSHNIKINQLYNDYIEYLTEIILKQPQNNIDLLLKTIKQLMGEYLFQRYIVQNSDQKQDRSPALEILNQYENLSHLEPKYTNEQQLLFICTQPIIASLSLPCSAQGILQKLLNVTLIFQNIILSTGKASDITADIQIPLTLFIFIKSKIINLYTLWNFVYSFILTQTMGSILGQIMTLLHSVVDLLENINASKLGLSEEEYKAKLEEMREYK